jgi:hypothetical protein
MYCVFCNWLEGQAWKVRLDLRPWNYSPFWECRKVRLGRVGLRKVRLVKGQAFI